ncbi:hypothetical protein M427DRAFT_488321 [Gonapodya prolifera JEL478]|uniref:BTB domain-containing protein n=1 Tax=Gonapodya prolifera (strain JEL478) TaxID=1344416 RepID=A0A139APS8_GONPJ|nr:hypothetical protein M427DRAFT_488321 [Gonapodya prolifera JEL478]|eukprot:KXS18750.1 hypothetical protein M427DRAFT_488321 [Gonapodya prolifera JEL478]
MVHTLETRDVSSPPNASIHLSVPTVESKPPPLPGKKPAVVSFDVASAIARLSKKVVTIGSHEHSTTCLGHPLRQAKKQSRKDVAPSETKLSHSRDFYLKDGDLLIELPWASGSETVKFGLFQRLLCHFSGFFRKFSSESWKRVEKDAKGGADLRILKLDDDALALNNMLRRLTKAEGFTINGSNYARLLQLADKYDMPLLLGECISVLSERPLTEALDNMLLVDRHVQVLSTRNKLNDKLVEEAANQMIARARLNHRGDFRCELSPFTEETQKLLIQAMAASHRGATLTEFMCLLTRVVPLVALKDQYVICPSCNSRIFNPDPHNLDDYDSGCETIGDHFIECIVSRGLGK